MSIKKNILDISGLCEILPSQIDDDSYILLSQNDLLYNNLDFKCVQEFTSFYNYCDAVKPSVIDCSRMVRVLDGEIIMYFFDIRESSSSFQVSGTLSLDDNSRKMLLIPPNIVVAYITISSTSSIITQLNKYLDLCNTYEVDLIQNFMMTIPNIRFKDNLYMLNNKRIRFLN